MSAWAGARKRHVCAQAEHYWRNADSIERIATWQGVYHVEVMELVARQRVGAEVAEFMAEVAEYRASVVCVGEGRFFVCQRCDYPTVSTTITPPYTPSGVVNVTCHVDGPEKLIEKLLVDTFSD